jgi:hypothetical protein
MIFLSEWLSDSISEAISSESSSMRVATTILEADGEMRTEKSILGRLFHANNVLIMKEPSSGGL